MSNLTKPAKSAESTELFTLLYFSFLYEKKGKSEEQRQLIDGLTAHDLFSSVCKELAINLKQTHVRVSINHTFVEWTQPIAAGDIVAFIPPVAGG